VLSVSVALTLTPALCATLLKPKDPQHIRAERGFFGWFNRNFARLVNRYDQTLGRLLKRSLPAMLLYGVLLIGLAVLFVRLPSGFLPDEDQGSMLVQFTLPTCSSTRRPMSRAPSSSPASTSAVRARTLAWPSCA
jgi:multidrug efflux pump subunit AcrB